MNKNTYKYKIINLSTNKPIDVFKNIDDIEIWINEQIKKRGLDGRVGYFVQFRDGLTVEVFKMNGKKLKI